MSETTDGHGHRQRLKERFLRNGENSLSDHELLELLLCFAIPRQDVKPLAKHLLRKFQSLHGVLTARSEELMLIKGVSAHTAILLQMSRSIFIRCLQNDLMVNSLLDTNKALEFYLRMQIGCLNNEQLFLILLNQKSQLIEKVVFPGSVNMAYCAPQEIFRAVLFYKNVSSIVLAHNHPLGSDIPSQNDIIFTRRLQFLLREIDISLRDHFIITPDKCISIVSSELYKPFTPQNF